MINLSQLLLRDSQVVSGKAGIVIGSAKSIKNLNRILVDGVRVGIGDVPWRAPEYGPFHYWVTSNSEYPLIWVGKDLENILSTDSTTLISTASVGNLNHKDESFFTQFRDNNIYSKIVAYDQRHFYNKLCEPIQNCCLFSKVLVNDLTIQELIGRKVGINGPAYSPGSTVALQGFALAILLNLNPIYIAGVEIPTVAQKYNHIHNFRMQNESLKAKIRRTLFQRLSLGFMHTDFTSQYSQIMRDFSTLTEIAVELGISTYCLSETSSLNKIPGIHRAPWNA